MLNVFNALNRVSKVTSRVYGKVVNDKKRARASRRAVPLWLVPGGLWSRLSNAPSPMSLATRDTTHSLSSALTSLS